MSGFKIPKLDLSRFSVDFEKVAKERIRAVAVRNGKKLLKPTEKWQNHKPRYYIDGPKIERGDLVCRAIIDMSTQDGIVYNYLDEGTDFPRHALMSQDFRPKTIPRSFKSNTGAGSVVKVSLQVQKPGIVPREWSIMVSESINLRNTVDTVVANIAKKFAGM